MDQELYGIVEFLIERAKSNMREGGFRHKGYFIMRYASKPKLVYAPLDISLVELPGLYRLIPAHIETTWQARKQAAEEEVTLIAVCTICTARYLPCEGMFCQFPDKIGSSCLTTTVNTQMDMCSYMTFYKRDSYSTITFDATQLNKSGFTKTGQALYPKNP